MTQPIVTHKGGCHCGAVAFEVDAPAVLRVLECNCSICAMTGYLHLIVPMSRFRLIRGADSLTTYTFGTHTAKHLFCARCGIKSCYVPRSHPDGVSVNARCLANDTVAGMELEAFDGQSWEQGAERLRSASAHGPSGS